MKASEISEPRSIRNTRSDQNYQISVIRNTFCNICIISKVKNPGAIRFQDFGTGVIIHEKYVYLDDLLYILGGVPPTVMHSCVSQVPPALYDSAFLPSCVIGGVCRGWLRSALFPEPLTRERSK